MNTGCAAPKGGDLGPCLALHHTETPTIAALGGKLWGLPENSDLIWGGVHS